MGDMNGDGKGDIALVNIEVAYMFISSNSGGEIGGSTGTTTTTTTGTGLGTTTTGTGTTTTGAGTTTTTGTGLGTTTTGNDTTSTPSGTDGNSSTTPTPDPEASSASYLDHSLAASLVAGAAILLINDFI